MLKTLLAEVAFADGQRRLVCAVVPVSGSLDLKALALAAGGRRGAMAEPVLTVVDETAELFETVLVSAGRRGLSVELAPADLVRLIGAVVSNVAR